MLKKIHLLLLLILLFSCEEDLPPPQNLQYSRVTTVSRQYSDVYGTAGAVDFNATFQNGKITELRNTANNQLYLFTYDNNDRITGKQYIVNQGTATEKSKKIEYTYNSNGDLVKEKFFDKPAGNSGFSEQFYYDFEYQTADPTRINKIKKYIPTSLISGQSYNLVGTATISYSSEGNISTIDATNLNNHVYNYFANSNRLLTHPLLPNLYQLSLYMKDDDFNLLPVLNNKNTVSTVSYVNTNNQNTETFQTNYIYQNNYLMEINNNISPLVKFTYTQ